MKKEELFDLLEEVDGKYISEAMFDDLDGDSPAVARPGKAKITPMKIIAPVAACLAVFAAAGFLVVNVNRGKPAVNPASAGSDYAVSEEFIEQCKEIVAGESELISQGEVVWQTNFLDIDFDGSDELLLYPQIDGETVSDVGVRVFAEVEDGIKDLGAFGNTDNSIDLDDIRRDERDGAGDQYYYYFSHDDERDGLYDGIRFVSYNAENGSVNGDKYLMRVTDSRFNPNLNEGFYEDGVYWHRDQSFIVKMREFPDDIAEIFCEFSDYEIAQCENDALTRNGKLELEELLTPKMWHVGEYDINFDGEKELLISLYNFSNMRGVFVYDKNCEYLGSFETENGLCDPELIELYDEDGERYWYYLGIESSKWLDGKNIRFSLRLERASINKIIVENNNFSTERLIHYDLIWDEDGIENHYLYWIGDKQVTKDDYYGADVYRAGCMGSPGFDLTNPDHWMFSSMFEDSELRNNERGQAELEKPSRFETAD